MRVRQHRLMRFAAVVLGYAMITASLRSAEVASLPPSHSVKPELFATGFEFAEGPAFDAHGNLFVVNYRGNGNIGRITPDGTAAVWCNLNEPAPNKQAPNEKTPKEQASFGGKRSQANGLKVDREGRLIAADSGIGRLLRISEEGKRIEVLADRFEDKPFEALNDVALDLKGNIYFTDPGSSNAEDPHGSVYRYDIATATVKRLATGLAYPNGVGVTPDQKSLCVSESARYRLTIMDLTADGATNQRVLIEFPKQDTGDIRGGEFMPDGLVFDAQGRLYVGMWTGGLINVIDVPSGQLVRQYDAGGSKSTNCHFFGTNLYVTVAAKEAVFRLPLGVEGFNYNR